MHKQVLMGVVAALVLATAGCGVDVPSADDIVDQAKSAAGSAAAEATQEALDQLEDATAGADDEGSGDASGGKDSPICASGGTPGMEALALGVQMLAQPNLDTVLAIRGGESPLAAVYDLDAMREGIEEYRVLDGRPADGYEDPKVVLDQWEDLTNRMDDMINGASEPTQADIDAYTAVMGEPQDLIMTQLDLGLAQTQYCS